HGSSCLSRGPSQEPLSLSDPPCRPLHAPASRADRQALCRGGRREGDSAHIPASGDYLADSAFRDGGCGATTHYRPCQARDAGDLSARGSGRPARRALSEGDEGSRDLGGGSQIIEIFVRPWYALGGDELLHLFQAKKRQ